MFIPFGDPGLFDEFLQTVAVAAFETPLLRVGKLIEWSRFEPEMMSCVVQAAKGPGGRPRFHPLLRFKGLGRQRLPGLADDATSFQITDRNSFRAFLGLTAADPVPAGPTIADFRAALVEPASLRTALPALPRTSTAAARAGPGEGRRDD